MKQFFICLLIGIVFTGCSQIPKPTSYQSTNQKKMQAAEHWNLFAKDISNQISLQIKSEGADSEGLAIIPNDNSAFCRSFRSFLSTELTKSQIQLKSDTDAVYQLDWAIQTLQHKAYRREMLPGNEIIINVYLKKNNQILYRSSNVFYVNDLDTDHYYTSKDNLGTDKEFNGKTYTISN